MQQDKPRRDPPLQFGRVEPRRRNLLTPHLMERIVERAARLNNKRGVSMAFMDSRLFLTIRTGSAGRRFEIENVFPPIRDGRERARSLLNELGQVTSIIVEADCPNGGGREAAFGRRHPIDTDFDG